MPITNLLPIVVQVNLAFALMVLLILARKGMASHIPWVCAMIIVANGGSLAMEHLWRLLIK